MKNSEDTNNLQLNKQFQNLLLVLLTHRSRMVKEDHLALFIDYILANLKNPNYKLTLPKMVNALVQNKLSKYILERVLS